MDTVRINAATTPNANLPRTITAHALRATLGRHAHPLVIDVRRIEAFSKATHLIAGATWRNPFEVLSWCKYLPRHVSIVVYCVHGFEISANVAAALAEEGLNVATLEGGIAVWEAIGAPLLAKMAPLPDAKMAAPLIPSAINAPSTWVTRARPKIDRIACPWLIRRFIDPLAAFVYVPANEVQAHAARTGAIAYDVPGVTFTHRGEMCSFDALMQDFDLQDASLKALAKIVRGADTGQPELTAQSPGLLALSLGLSQLYADDHTMLNFGMIAYDAYYAWLQSAQAEVHNADLFNKAKA
jgi:rhodanese-related sulfurtransferase